MGTVCLTQRSLSGESLPVKARFEAQSSYNRLERWSVRPNEPKLPIGVLLWAHGSMQVCLHGAAINAWSSQLPKLQFSSFKLQSIHRGDAILSSSNKPGLPSSLQSKKFLYHASFESSSAFTSSIFIAIVASVWSITRFASWRYVYLEFLLLLATWSNFVSKRK